MERENQSVMYDALFYVMMHVVKNCPKTNLMKIRSIKLSHVLYDSLNNKRSCVI